MTFFPNDVVIVSGYIPIPEVVNIKEADFRALGVRLADALPRGRHLDSWFKDDTDENDLAQTWVWRLLYEHDLDLTASDPNPDPNRFDPPGVGKLYSNFVMHEKYRWMAEAALDNPESNIFCWIDYGVLKQEGMTPEVVTSFCERLINTPEEWLRGRITAPGIKSIISEPDPQQSWDRFCGSVVIADRDTVFALQREAQILATKQIKKTGQVTIESNVLAGLEYWKILNFNWYQSWWGRSMFEAYHPPEPVQTC